MTSLLSAAEYAGIARSLKFPTRSFVNGESYTSLSGKTFTTTNPATDEVLAEITACNAQDVDFAVAKAKAAFEDGRWHKLSPGERKKVLLRFADLLEQNAHELAVLESLDSGKPVRECQLTDVPETIHTLRWHAELIDKIYDNTAPVGNGALTLVVREAIGVVGLVLPWNFPLLMLAWKIGPSLAAGCSIIVKPAKETTLTALRVAELAFEAGVPAGVFNVLSGGGSEVGEPLGRHMDVSMVSFTGSTATGRRFLNYAADSNLKRVVLECGGKNPAVVMKDVEDLDSVASHVVNGAFWNMGENCSASSRLIVHADIKDELLKRIGVQMLEWKMGSPWTRKTAWAPWSAVRITRKSAPTLSRPASRNCGWFSVATPRAIFSSSLPWSMAWVPIASCSRRRSSARYSPSPPSPPSMKPSPWPMTRCMAWRHRSTPTTCATPSSSRVKYAPAS